MQVLLGSTAKDCVNGGQISADANAIKGWR